MTKFSRVIHLLPLLWPLLICVTIFTPYFIAVSLDHVNPFLPSISKTAAFEPEGSIFGVLLTFVAFSGLVAIFCRYLQLDGRRFQEDFKKGTLQKVKRLNKVCLPLGVSCILGVVIVANFRSPLGEQYSVIPIGKVHDAGTALLLFSGVLYYWFQTLISYHTVKVGLNSKYMLVFRVAVCCIMFFTGVAYPFFKWFSYSKFRGDSVAKWKVKDGGYILHVASSTGEWIACLSLAIYAASFYKEFQTFAIKVCYVENDETKKERNINYKKIEQTKDEERE